MKGKKILIFGIANKKSIATGIAQCLSDHGANLGLSYQSEILKSRIEKVNEDINSDFIFQCDVSSDESIDAAFVHVEQKWNGELDGIVHSVAFSDKEELTGGYIDTSRKNFSNSLDISCYSLVACAQRAQKYMKNGGSIIAMSYYGAEKVIPHYNVMGVAKAALEMSAKCLAYDLGPKNIRVNIISAGPMKTLAASGIGGFQYIFKWNEENAPLRRNITQEELGQAALYLLSDMSSGVTGEVHHVDGGYNINGMKALSDEERDMILGKKSI